MFGVALTAGARLVGAAPVPVSPRVVISLDSDWRFHRGDLPGAGLGQPVAAWRWKADDRGEAASAEFVAEDLKTDGIGWTDASPGTDTFTGRRGFAWFQAILPAK